MSHSVSNPTRCTRLSDQHGFTVVEVVISLLVISVVLLSALRTAATLGTEARVRREMLIGQQLAEDLLAEIMVLPSEDYDEVPTFGPEPSEVGVTRRNLFDDIDDFHGWDEWPVQDSDGNAIAQYSRWRRLVSVHWIHTLAPVPVGTDTGLKGVTVTVISPSGKTYARSALRSMTQVRDRSQDAMTLRVGISLTAGSKNYPETLSTTVALENAPQ